MSGLGFGIGYVGSALGLMFAIPLISTSIDLVWVMVALFFLVFSVPSFLYLPKDEAESALAAHPELYERQADGGIALKIVGGHVDLSSLGGVGYGYDADIDFEARTPLADWSIPEGL